MSFSFADVLDQLSIIVAIHLGVEGTRITGSPVVVSFCRTFESDKVENVVQTHRLAKDIAGKSSSSAL